jgi:hypothetical protein
MGLLPRPLFLGRTGRTSRTQNHTGGVPAFVIEISLSYSAITLSDTFNFWMSSNENEETGFDICEGFD